MSAAEVVPDLLPRVRAAASATRDAQDAFDLEKRLRDQLIVKAVDAGISQRAIAEAAGLAKSRIVAIVGNQYTEHLL